MGVAPEPGSLPQPPPPAPAAAPVATAASHAPPAPPAPSAPSAPPSPAPPAAAPAAAGPVICTLRGIEMAYPGSSGRGVKVLDGIDLEVRESEVLALLGPLGCGKSTLMRILCGLLHPTAGEVLYRGSPLRGLNPGVAIVFQNFALIPWLDVAENVEVALHAKGLAPVERRARLRRVLDLVGLEGYETAYPRELSGGIKQCVGIARALAVEPEILCLDEPFSQVDALTAQKLRVEMLNLWIDREKNPKTILLVSHDVTEVAFLANRIVVFDTNPGRIQRVVENPLPYPRNPRAQEFRAFVERLHDVITHAILPDVPAEEAAAAGLLVEPLPDATAGEIIGLLEALDDHHGEMEIFRFANEIGAEYGRLIAVIKAAEDLGFVDTPRRKVIFTELGQRFVKCDVNGRKSLFNVQLRQHALFRVVLKMLHNAADGELDKELILDELALLLPSEDPEKIFDVLVNLGRYGELVTYDLDRDKVALHRPAENGTPAP